MTNNRNYSGTGVPPVKKFKETRRNLPHLQQPDSIYFITWQCSIENILAPQERDIVLKAICYWNNIKWIVYCAVVMPDHVHILGQPLEKSNSGSFNLSEIIYSVKSFSAHEINRLRGKKGNVWQDERYDRIVRDDAEFKEKWQYIRTNPVRTSLVEKPEEYMWLFEKL